MRHLFRRFRIARALPALAAAAIAFALAPLDTASAAYTYERLHSFCVDCNDGYNPQELVMDRNGILYGIARGGVGDGVVYELVPNADKTKYTEHLLHSFCKTNPNCGASPSPGVVLDVDGNIYGTTYYSGTKKRGEVFKLTNGSWTLSVLKSFCEESNCADGSYPDTGLSYAGQDSGKAWDKSSPLFGTTDDGGKYHKGTVFELTPTGSSWNYAVIHNLQLSTNPNEVLVGSGGNIYGTTQYGGKYGGGLIYKLAKGTWSETTLYNFCKLPNCADGSGPQGRLVMDASGNLFGATLTGGSNSNDYCNGGTGATCGVVFERDSGGTYSVVYNFCSQATNCADGATPGSGVIIDGSGNIFGTTVVGGVISDDGGTGGTVYEISGGTESVLYSFCSQHECNDGESPYAAVILDSSGGLFGTTADGGAHGYGTAFRLGP